jgi:hypothetical protein
MRGSPSGWGARWPVLALAGVLMTACAGPLLREGARWRVREGGASVADLAALEPGWQQRASDGALLAFAHADGTLAAWLRQCRGASAAARPEAHALLVRLAAAEVQQEGPVQIAGREGWAVVASALDDGHRVTLKTVTRVSAQACTDDFVLVTAEDFSAREAGFDRWWASFEDGGAG